MAFTSNARPVAGYGRSSAVFHRLTEAFAAWDERRQTRKALSRLTEEQLHDIGLTRGDIDDI